MALFLTRWFERNPSQIGGEACHDLIMSAPDLSSSEMKQFAVSGAESHLTILLGAGASTTSGLPDWDTFATRLLLESGSVTDPAIAKLLVERQDPLLVVEAARSAFGDRWNQQLRRALYDGVSSLDPSPLHLAAVGHLLTGDGTDTSLVTLNFDTLLEIAVEAEVGEMPYASSDGMSPEGSYAVHHLHGVVTPSETRDVILTLTDFTSLVANNSSWQSGYFRSALDRGALIIAGTSYRDPDVRQWVHAALKDKPVSHDGLVLLARQGFSLSKDQFRDATRALRDQWTAVGLQPVFLQDFADAAQIIRELRHIHKDHYLAPKDRAKEVWDAHADRFPELQADYVSELEIDATVMGDALDVERLNVTLWIADGEGKLVRWAAQDRLHRDVAVLRRVETGHDSPWVSGQALGAETLLFQDLEESGNGQWRSVLALPIPIPHPDLPTLSAVVLTIGLPEPASRFERTSLLWGEPLGELGNKWGERLSSVALSG